MTYASLAVRRHPEPVTFECSCSPDCLAIAYFRVELYCRCGTLYVYAEDGLRARPRMIWGHGGFVTIPPEHGPIRLEYPA